MTKEERLQYIEENIEGQGNQGAILLAPLLRDMVANSQADGDVQEITEEQIDSLFD
ncbi:MAG: hypothetical protein NC344_06925 [Bacteroidales bacterium]|nr:hypothetical protein [Bacteroidales bacterium]MCM1147550.1 hypothetical protein [Bacteroidales bacterium]MCM1206340.1 hypothetical protein [Bacillota bacterium]MCM1511231.1 hypothetical protein [Clostridium sp.]